MKSIGRYDPTDDVTAGYPPTFMLGSNYDGDGYAHEMALLSAALEENEVLHEFFYERYGDGGETRHGLPGALISDDPIAVHAYDAMMSFLDSTAPVAPVS